ncbi:recombinase family protein [Paenibacillus sp. FSL R5-0345]|uniref:recombinase family protein n=1 Tax=Paenibacillus sp. FSL R5-0345 TaxID=1536770 RepID=UPI000693B377|nr:recombinase family protein [Paenibacillus sp. FSL R5-0345]
MESTVALYIRVSTDEQVDGYSIDGQMDMLKAYCRQHNLTIYKSYIDAGKSAKSIQGRPLLQQLLVDAQQGCFQNVLVWKLNRLSRNHSDLLQMVKIFNKSNVGIKSATEDINTDTTMGSFVVQVLSAIAELEREQICDNVRLAVQERNRQGCWNSGNMVLGYRWHKNPDPGQQQLEIVEPEAELVRTIFTMYADGLGYKAITNRLNAAGCLTKKGLAFGIAAVRGILTNPNYIGKIRIGTSQRHTGAEVQLIEGEQEAIITLELWEQVQANLRSRSNLTSKTIKRHFPLSGLLKCPECGCSMVAAHTKSFNKNGTIRKNYYYVCSLYRSKGSASCSLNAIRADNMDCWFSQQMQELVTKPPLLNQIIAAVNDKRDLSRKPLEDEKRGLTKELAAFDQRQQRCFELFEEEHIPQEVLVTRLKELEEQKAVKQEALRGIEEKLANQQIQLVDSNKILTALKNLWAMVQISPHEQQKKLFKSLFDKITLPPDKDISKAVLHGSASLNHILFTNNMEELQCKINSKSV